MSVRAKLLVIILFVALVPLTVSALMALGVHRRAYNDKVAEGHRLVAFQAASRSEAYFDEIERRLATLAGRTIRWRELSAQESSGALWLVYEQFNDAVVVSLLDDTGKGVGRSAYLDPEMSEANHSNHPLASRKLLEAYARRIPFEFAQGSTASVMGEPFWIDGDASPILPVAVGVPGPTPGSKWVVALGLSLRTLCSELAAASPHGIEIVAVDRAAHQVCPFATDRPLQVVDEALVRIADSSQPTFSTYDAPGKQTLLVSGITLRTGWRLFARQPAEDAMAASQRLLQQTVLWIAISLVIALAAGWLLGRSVSVPIARLVQGSRELAKGNLAYRLRMSPKDEFGKLGEAFDQMSEKIALREDEIRNWNENLQRRVEARTRELTDAHEQLLQSQKLAALSSLGSGVAHEINNPLTGVLGMTQVLLAQARSDPDRAKDVRLLENVERESLRIKGIVKRMLALSQGESRRDQAPIHLNGLLDATVRLLEREIAAADLQVQRQFDPDLPAVKGVFTQLQQALLQVLSNAITATASQGRIVLSTTQVQQHVCVTIADSGKGIPEELLGRIFEPFFTTKDAWAGEGLGLAIVHRVVENHHGTIKVESEVGTGTTVTMSLPIAKDGSHLD